MVTEALDHLCFEERLRVFSLEQKSLRGILLKYRNSWRKNAKKTGPSSSHWCSVKRQEAAATNWKTGEFLWTSKHSYLRVMEYTGWPRTLWSLQSWSYISEALWTWPWSAGCRLSYLSRGFDQMTFRDPCQPQPVCDFVIAKMLLCYQLHFSHRFKILCHPRVYTAVYC